jgi:hypothetical protein
MIWQLLHGYLYDFSPKAYFLFHSWSSRRQKMDLQCEISPVILSIGFHGFGFLHKISTPPFSLSFKAVHALSQFLFYIFLLSPIDKADLRYLYRCSYTDKDLRVIEVAL